MQIHAIQTGTVAIKKAQRHAATASPIANMLRVLTSPDWTEPLPIYAWVIEHPEGLIVVDTGETARVHEPGYQPGWHPYYRRAVREWVAPQEEIGPQLQALGYDPRDVRWVVMTHLHTDHAGGLHHFPTAEVLMTPAEWRAAQGFPGRLKGYLSHRFPAWLSPTLVSFQGAPVGPWLQSYALTRAGDVLLVPTPGHSAGHLSVLVREGERWLCFAGDTSYTQDLLLAQRGDGVSPDPRAAKETLAKLLQLAQAEPLVYLPSHDPRAAERLARRETVPLRG